MYIVLYRFHPHTMAYKHFDYNISNSLYEELLLFKNEIVEFTRETGTSKCSVWVNDPDNQLIKISKDVSDGMTYDSIIDFMITSYLEYKGYFILNKYKW